MSAADIVERLRATKVVATGFDMKKGRFEERTLINPDGPEAVTEIEALRARETELPDDVRRLVIAVREVAYTDTPEPEAMRELDKAVEAFAERVGWDDQPEDVA